MTSMDYPPPSVNQPEVGLALLPRDQLPWLRTRYVELLRDLGVSPALVYVYAILQEIDMLTQSGSVDRGVRG
jgi:hypothetical protein